MIGANGFLGSHVTRQLVDGGAEVRAMVREGAKTIGIDDLAVQRFYGDVFDTEVLREAMTGCDVVYYCVVDTRAWLRDPAPLFRTNVEGVRNVLEVARTTGSQAVRVHQQLRHDRPAAGAVHFAQASSPTEQDTLRWHRSLGPYALSRLQAEELVLRYADEHGVPAVAMCVSTTYGTGDWNMTPHGAMVAGAAFGKVPFVMKGIRLEVVGVDDAARAMILAAEHGRNGERYIISEKMMTQPADRPHRRRRGAAYRCRAEVDFAADALRDGGAWAASRPGCSGTQERLTLRSLRLMRAEAEVDHSKAVRELGWQPSRSRIRSAPRHGSGSRCGRREESQSGAIGLAARRLRSRRSRSRQYPIRREVGERWTCTLHR